MFILGMSRKMTDGILTPFRLCSGSMPTTQPPTQEAVTRPTLHHQMYAAIDLLERLAADWSLLDQFPAGDRARLHRAIDGLSVPERHARRKRAKQADRERRRTRLDREEAVLDQTGIRTLRRRPVVTTPNVLPPARVDERDEIGPGTAPGVSVVDRHCYVCKDGYSRIHHFYDQLCPACADFNFAATDRAGRPARPRGAADGRARQDRLPGRAQAAAIAART